MFLKVVQKGIVVVVLWLLHGILHSYEVGFTNKTSGIEHLLYSCRKQPSFPPNRTPFLSPLNGRVLA